MSLLHKVHGEEQFYINVMHCNKMQCNTFTCKKAQIAQSPRGRAIGHYIKHCFHIKDNAMQCIVVLSHVRVNHTAHVDEQCSVSSQLCCPVMGR